MMLSSTSKVEVFIIVFVPSTFKSPAIVTFPEKAAFVSSITNSVFPSHTTVIFPSDPESVAVADVLFTDIAAVEIAAIESSTYFLFEN